MLKVARKVLCLDWDKRAVRIVVAQVGGGEMKLEDAHAHRIPGSIDPEVPQALGALLAQLLERHRIRITRVIVDVPRDRAIINRLTVPPTPLAELAAAVRFQAMRELPFPIDEAQIDYVVTARNEDGLATEVLLAAVRLEVLHNLQETCRAAGLTPTRIGLRPYANLISVIHLPALLDRRVLFLDVGPTMTEIDVICGNTLAFSRAANVSVPFQGGELDLDDSRVSSKTEIGELALADTVEATAVSELLVEITRTLQAYRATAAEGTIDQIVIAGGTGIEPGLAEAVEERFGLPTMLFDPTVPLGVDEAEAPKLRAFASTLGLAWGLSKEGLLELDFLNPKRPLPPRAALKRRLRAGAIAGVVLLVALAGYAVADRVRNERTLSRLKAQTQELLERAQADLDVQIRCMEAEAWQAEADAAVWLDHLLWITQQVVEPGKELLATDIDCGARSGIITLNLLCSDRDVATRFVNRLNEVVGARGQRLYRAEVGTWQQAKTIDPRFKGRVDVRIELLEVTGRPDVKQREQEYRRMRRIG